MSNYVESYVTSQRITTPQVEPAIAGDLIPEQQRETADVLIRLLEDYYKHLNSKGLPSYEINRIQNESDIDRASLDYIDRIQNEIALTFPRSLSFNKVSFYKRVVDYYSSRGNENSAVTFFKLFFDETIDIFYPKEQLFRLSEGNWNLDKDSIDDFVTGFTNVELDNSNIGETLYFFNRPSLSHSPKFYVHGADEDSFNSALSNTWSDISSNGYNISLSDSLKDNYLISEKAYEFSGSEQTYGIINNLTYGGGNTISELSCFVWMRTDYTSSPDGKLITNNWSLIDFDRSEVFSLYVNGDGFLAFSGRPTNRGGIGTNMTSASSNNFDIAANGRPAGDTSSAVDTSLKVNDGDYHYVGVTYSVANQRIILWIDGVAKFVATGDGSLGALGSGYRRYGVIGDGAEGPSLNNDYDISQATRNHLYFDGAISAIHLHDDVEICDNDNTIAIGDTNSKISANKLVTDPTTYPEQIRGKLDRFIRDDWTSNPITPTISLDDHLRAYYNISILDSYSGSGGINVNDISKYNIANGIITCEYCSALPHSLVFNPAAAPNPKSVIDNIGVNNAGRSYSYDGEHTILAWIKKDNYVSATSESAYSCIARYDSFSNDNLLRCLSLYINQEDGSIGTFVTNNTDIDSSVVLSDRAQFSTINKMTDDNWHLVGIRGNSSGNGSIDINIDGGAWENIFTGSSPSDAFMLDFVSNEFDVLSIGNTKYRAGNESGTWQNGFLTISGDESSRSYFPFSGEFNSLLFYDKQLTEEEVLSIYNEMKFNVENTIVSTSSTDLIRNGSITKKYRLYYDDVEHAEASSASKIIFEDISGNPSLLNITFTEGLSVVGGRYLDKKSFASSINKLQDSDYWQDFSYEIQSGISTDKWINEFLNLVHPAGMKLFAALIIKIFKDNEWDYHYIEDYYSLKQALVDGTPNTEDVENELAELEKEINELYRIKPEDGSIYDNFKWIRDVKTDSYNPTGYGIPTYQPGYLYKDFAILTFIIEAYLTPSEDRVLTDEEQYWINVGKNYFAHVILAVLTQSNENINQRMYSQYALGQLKFIAEHGPMSQYADYRLDQGALEETFNPEQPLKFTALNSLIRTIGIDNIFPYVRGFFTGPESSSAPATTASGYDLSSREVDGNGDTYDNSSIDPERTDLGIL